MLSRSPPVLPPAQRSRGGPATLGLASYFLGSGSIRGATQQRVTCGENTGRPWGETGCPRWAPGRRGSGLLEAGRAGGGLTPHRVLPAEPRFLSAEWGGSRKLPPLGSCAPRHHPPCHLC